VAAADRAANAAASNDDWRRLSQGCHEFVRDIAPLCDAWQGHAPTVARVGGFLQYAFEILRRYALAAESVIPFREALQLTAEVPMGTRWTLSGNIYLEAVDAVAEVYRSQTSNMAAAVLMEYAIHYATSNRWLVDDYVLLRAYESAGTEYANLAFVHRAHACVANAQRRATGKRKRRLSNRAHELSQKTQDTSEVDELQRWRAQAEALCEDPDFACLVNEQLFADFCRAAN
jgi:hypothetical protein